jgi:hypothetical protein
MRIVGPGNVTWVLTEEDWKAYLERAEAERKAQETQKSSQPPSSTGSTPYSLMDPWGIQRHGRWVNLLRCSPAMM